MPLDTSRPALLDLLYVSVLVLYVFAGMMLAPFHGDEATTIYQAKDWYRVTSLASLPNVFYHAKFDDPRLADEQEFRLQNGVISKYAIGLMTSILGQPVEAMNDPWFWGADYNDNQAHGHIPTPTILLAARFSSTAMLALSVVLIFRICWRLHGRNAAWIGALMYTTLPAVLVNGRRGMFEGATLLGIALVVECTLVLGQRIQSSVTNHNRLNYSSRWIVLGLSCGFAIASKHSLLIIVAPALGLLLVIGRMILRRTISGALLASAIMILTFLLLNPAWWSAPLTVPGEVLRLRQGILKAQVDIFGGYQNVPDRVSALTRYPLGPAQYYEDKQNWINWIGNQISAYEASRTSGFDWTRLGLVIYPLMALGVAVSLASRHTVNRLFAGISIFVVAMVFVATPLPWQRYYLLLAPLWSIALAVGTATAVHVAWIRYKVRTN